MMADIGALISKIKANCIKFVEHGLFFKKMWQLECLLFLF